MLDESIESIGGVEVFCSEAMGVVVLFSVFCS
jgi:hypothetical protein